jgi:signal transduction histidine kinase
MESIRAILSFCVLFLGFASVAFPQQHVVVNTDFVKSSLQGNLWHISDSTHQLNPLQILAIRRQGGGTIPANSIPNLGDGNESHWVVFEIDNRALATQKLLLELYSSKLDAIAFFVFDGYELIRQTPIFSWRTPIENRDLPYRAFTYGIEIPSQKIQTVMLRLVKKNGVLSLPIRLHQQKSYILYMEQEHFMHGLTVGVMLLAFVLGMTLFLLSRQWLYFFYAGHIVGIAIFLLAEQNYLNQYLLPYCELAAGSSAWAIGAMVSTFNHNCFSLLFFKIGLLKRNFWVYLCWVVNAIATGIFCWLLFGFPLTDSLYQFVLFFSVAYILVAFALLLYSIFKRVPEAFLYTLAISPFWILAILTVLNVLDIVPRLWLVMELIDYAPALEVAILCIGLAYTFQRDQREKVKSLLVISSLREKVVSVRVDAQGAERRRVAADLHDNLGGMMSAIRLSIEAMDASELSQKEKAVYENVLTMTRQAYNDVRLLAHNLQPEELEKFGLPEALQRLVNKLNDSQTIRFSLTMNTLGRLNKELEFTLYSICLELANNIVKHSQATEASFEFVDGGQHFQLLVTDNGKGFIQHNTSDGMGMKNIQERTVQMEGTLKVHSRPGEGMLVQFMIPLRSSTHV